LDSLSPAEDDQALRKKVPATNAEELELVKGLQAGDQKAVAILYTSYFDRLYNFIFHSVKRNKALAEDIIQETFVSALKGARQFKGNSKLYTWLVGIANHKIIDHYRNQAKDRSLNIRVIERGSPGSEPVSDASQVISDGVESTELRLTVRQALSNLPLDYREVLLLKYIENMTISEISQVMDRSPKSVDGLLTRARKMLKENLPGDMR
jgi:RNA polymerase sigma-70 factor (ECF subfamily)